MPNDTLWTDGTIDELRDELGDVYRGRTALVTGADGFMGSHLTEALVELGATVHAFVRATSSGALNNIGELRGRIKVHFADLTDRTSVDYLVRELKETAPDRPYVFHLARRPTSGESWHRPYRDGGGERARDAELLQSVVDAELEVEKFDTAGTSEEYGNVRESVTDHHDFDEAGGLILHERSPINPKSIYATSKVAADFLTMNYFDAFGIPGVVTRMFNNYGPRQNPRYVTGTIITQALTRDAIELGNLEPLRDFCFCTDGVRGHLTVAAKGAPGDVYVYGQGENISMRNWAGLIIELGVEHGYWPDDRHLSSVRAVSARAAATCSRSGSVTRSSPPRRAGSPACPGQTASCRRSAGTRRTATAGSAEWTGSRPRLPRFRVRRSATRAQSCTSSVQRYPKSLWLWVGALAQRNTTRRCRSRSAAAASADMTLV